MISLSPEQEDRSIRLHRESIVIDTMGFAPAFSKGIRKYIDEALARHENATVVAGEVERRSAFDLGELEPEWEEARKLSGQTAFSYTVGPWGKTVFSYENALRDLAAWTLRLDRVERMVKVDKAADIERAKREDKVGVILNFQNTTHIGADLDNLDFFYSLGIRIIQLTYNDQNLVGAGCTERQDGGLSRFGIRVVERMNRLGIMVDLSHCGYRTTMDAIEASSVPVVFSHTLCKAINNHDRGKTDKQLAALARKGGYAGMTTVPFFITDGGKPTLDHFMDHLDHLVKVMGVDKVGIGTDWGSGEPEALSAALDQDSVAAIGFRPEHQVSFLARTEGYRDWRDLPNLTRAIVSRGYSDEEVRGILGGNFLRLFRQVVG